MKDQYYHTEASVEEYIRAVEGFSGEALIEKLKHVLPVEATVLEFGSGPGTDWKILSESYTVTGSDYSSTFVNHLQTKNPQGKFLQLNASTVQTDKQFDSIYSNKVLHHLTDEELTSSIKRQHEILNPEGVICHSFWKGEGSEVFKGLFVNYHDEAALTKAFEAHFEIIALELYAEFEDSDSLLFIGKRKPSLM
ncbi:MAG: trans-aconitate 2-methyltransferase [Bacteroidia bacterium]